MINNEGQIGVDFLLGISIFLLALSFTIQFIPGLFISTHGNNGGLSSVAYRTASLLAEDPGWWENNTHNGTDWETHIENTSRIGLAADTSINTRLTYTPNLLNKTKILQMMQLDEETLTTKLGLYDNVNGKPVVYGYNITLLHNNTPLVINSTPATFGKTPPISQDIFKITRVVLVETGKVAGFSVDELTAEPPLPNDKVIINISGPQGENVILQMNNFNVTGPNPKFQSAKKDSNPLTSSNYTAYKKTNTSDFFTYSDPLNSTDTLRLIFNQSLFPDNTTYQLELKFSQINFTEQGPPYSEYTARMEPLYESANLVVEVWR
jgi:hypothetical protein